MKMGYFFLLQNIVTLHGVIYLQAVGFTKPLAIFLQFISDKTEVQLFFSKI